MFFYRLAKQKASEKLTEAKTALSTAWQAAHNPRDYLNSIIQAHYGNGFTDVQPADLPERWLSLKTVPWLFKTTIGAAQGILKVIPVVLGAGEAVTGKTTTYAYDHFPLLLRELTVVITGTVTLALAGARKTATYYLMPITTMRENRNFGALATGGLHSGVGYALYVGTPVGLSLAAAYGTTMTLSFITNIKQTPLYETCSSAHVLQKPPSTTKLQPKEFYWRLAIAKILSGKFNHHDKTYCGDNKAYTEEITIINSTTQNGGLGLTLLKNFIDLHENPSLFTALRYHPAVKFINLPDKSSSWLETLTYPIGIIFNLADSAGKTIRVFLTANESIAASRAQYARAHEAAGTKCNGTAFAYTTLYFSVWPFRKLFDQWWAPIDSFQAAWNEHWTLGVLSAAVSVALQGATYGATLPRFIPTSLLTDAATLPVFKQIADLSSWLLRPFRIKASTTALGVFPSVSLIVAKLLWRNLVYATSPSYKFVETADIQAAIDAAENNDPTVSITTVARWKVHYQILNALGATLDLAPASPVRRHSFDDAKDAPAQQQLQPVTASAAAIITVKDQKLPSPSIAIDAPTDASAAAKPKSGTAPPTNRRLTGSSSVAVLAHNSFFTPPSAAATATAATSGDEKKLVAATATIAALPTVSAAAADRNRNPNRIKLPPIPANSKNATARPNSVVTNVGNVHDFLNAGIELLRAATEDPTAAFNALNIPDEANAPVAVPAAARTAASTIQLTPR
jgi:hypothetical protein